MACGLLSRFRLIRGFGERGVEGRGEIWIVETSSGADVVRDLIKREVLVHHVTFPLPIAVRPSSPLEHTATSSHRNHFSQSTHATRRITTDDVCTAIDQTHTNAGKLSRLRRVTAMVGQSQLPDIAIQL